MAENIQFLEYNREKDVRYKVTLLGDSSVGKTSMLARLSGKKHDICQPPTIGMNQKCILNTRQVTT